MSDWLWNIGMAGFCPYLSVRINTLQSTGYTPVYRIHSSLQDTLKSIHDTLQSIQDTLKSIHDTLQSIQDILQSTGHTSVYT